MKKILCLAVILIVYRTVFTNQELVGGDWPHYFSEYLSTFKLPEIWNSLWPTGLGGNQAIILPLKLYLQAVVWFFVNTLGIPWPIVQKVFFFWLFLGLAIYSSYKLTKSWIGVLIYTTNTWILLVLSGGQIGIALAYAIAPLVLSQATESIKYKVLSIKYVIIAALIFAIQVMFDIRVAFLTAIIFSGYAVLHHFFIGRINLRNFIIHYSLFIIQVVLLHAFWILPSVFIALKGGNVSSIVDTTFASLEFFSFAKFENSLSLLHPNWPENIFGKVAFMRPEFLIIPMIAFASLLFVNSKLKNQKSKLQLKNQNSSNIAIEQYNNRTILFFALVGLIGAFLAKGTQEPFGVVLSWLYSNIPGFNLFRDPVKFYILIAFAYSVLIPYSIRNLGKFKKVASIVFILFWAYLNLPFILQSNIGVFKQRSIPSEYVRLKDYLISKPKFFRTLWIPTVQRFAFMSDNHPTLAYQDVFKTKKLEEKILSDMSVKYVIIPYDSEGEIFLNDRKYDDKLYQKTIDELERIPWLKKVEGPVLSGVERFGKIVVYEISNPKPHIWSSGDKLIFSESFDSNWYVDVGGRRVYSKPFGSLNSFSVPQKEQSSVIIHYEPQKWTTIGYLVSGLTLLVVLGIIGISLRRK